MQHQTKTIYHWFTNQHSQLKNRCRRHWRPEAILFICSQQHPSSLTSNTGIWGNGWDITSLSPTWSFSRRRVCQSCLWITFRPLLLHVKESVQRSQSSCSFPNVGKVIFCFSSGHLLRWAASFSRCSCAWIFPDLCFFWITLRRISSRSSLVGYIILASFWMFSWNPNPCL